MTAPIETPILALGRRGSEALQRMRDHDRGGAAYDRMPSDCAHRLNGAACDEYFALSRIVCSIPAETLPDALVQLGAAMELMETLVAGDNAVTRDPDVEAECRLIERGIAGALRVLLEMPGALANGLRREDYANFAENKWDGELPAVRVGDPEPRRCVPRMDEGGS